LPNTIDPNYDLPPGGNLVVDQWILFVLLAFLGAFLLLAILFFVLAILAICTKKKANGSLDRKKSKGNMNLEEAIYSEIPL
jgi:hypothetical protein